MLKHILVRLKKVHHGQLAFANKQAQLVNSALEKRDPALKNLTEGLVSRGLAYDVDGCDLYWFQIDDDKAVEFYQPMNEVECVFESSWFETEKDRIRHLSGIRYFDACMVLASAFGIKEQDRLIRYSLDAVAA